MDDVHRKPLNVRVSVSVSDSGSTFNLVEATAVKTSGLNLIVNLIVAPCIFVESLQFINQRIHM